MSTSTFENVLKGLAHASWQAAVLGILVLVTTWLFRSWLTARWRFALWLVVVVRFALPITMAAGWSLFSLFQQSPPAQVVMDVPQASTSISERSTTEVVLVKPLDKQATVPSLPSVEEIPGTVEPPQQPTSSLSWVHLVGGIWLVVLTLLLGRQAIMALRFRNQCKQWSTPIESALDELFARCLKETELNRKVSLRLAPGNLGPGTFGIWKPVVVVPEKLIGQLSDSELRLLLLHEFEHIRRRDVLIDRLSSLVVAVHWFNPIAWLTLHSLRRERELACDEAVLSRLSDSEPRQYGHALLQIAQRLPRLAPPATTIGIFGNERFLIRRIQMIASYRQSGRLQQAFGSTILAALLVFGLTDAKPKEAAAVEEKAKAVASEEGIKIAGSCVDKDGKPLAGVKVAVYRDDHKHPIEKPIHEVVTGEDGKYQFDTLPESPLENGLHQFYYVVTASKAGLASSIFYAGRFNDNYPFRLAPAATLQGKVTDQQGKPIAGALVSVPPSPIPSIQSAITNERGEYQISDLSEFDLKNEQSRPLGKRTFAVLAGMGFGVSHLRYASKYGMFTKAPSTVNIVMEPPARIEGIVIDKSTGKLAANVSVQIGSIDYDNPAFQDVQSDLQGKYIANNLPAGKYTIWANSPDHAHIAIENVKVKSGDLVKAPPLELIEGSVVEGQILDSVTGKPFQAEAFRTPLTVALWGPSHPKSSNRHALQAVDKEGRFRFLVPPGVQYLSIADGKYWPRTHSRTLFEQGIEVKPNEVVRVVMKVVPEGISAEANPKMGIELKRITKPK
jgi:bla regulator protein BlaR1